MNTSLQFVEAGAYVYNRLLCSRYSLSFLTNCWSLLMQILDSISIDLWIFLSCFVSREYWQFVQFFVTFNTSFPYQLNLLKFQIKRESFNISCFQCFQKLPHRTSWLYLLLVEGTTFIS